MVRDADQNLMDVIVHLLEIEHHQIGDFQQFVDDRIVATHKAVGVQTGVNAFRLTGAEPVAHELSL